MTENSPHSQTVSEVVWPWRTPAPAFHSPAPARVILMSCIPYAVAAWLFFMTRWEHRHLIATVATTAGTIQLFLGLFLPKAYVKVEGALLLVVQLVGFLLTWILLVPLYYSFFLLARIGLALRRKDLLHRVPDPSVPGYWVERDPVRDPDVHYRRQY